MVKTIVAILLLFIGNTFAQAPINEDFVKEESAKVESKIDEKIKERFDSLNSQTPQTNVKLFSHGAILMRDGKIVWRDKGGMEQILVSNKNLEEGYLISGFEISPDSLKLAYYTTYGGQDLKKWNVVTIDKQPQVLLSSPVENRMQGFSWNKNNDGLYYSFWNDKDEVKKGNKPIIEVRYRDLNTGEDTIVFDHKMAENFAIADIDGGNTLAAYRILNPDAGIKTTFSLYKGEKQSDGTYKWSKAYPRNEYVGTFLGIFNNKVVILTSEVGDTYGVVAIDLLNNKKEEIVSALGTKVLHTAEMAGDNLILQYHTIPEQNVSVVQLNLETKEKTQTEMSDLGLTPFGNLSSFNFGPGSQTARARYSDVMFGEKVIEMELESGKIQLLQNPSELDFDFTKVKQELVQFETQDGTKISGRLYTLKNKPPAFVFIRSYGWISIKNSPEPKEVQMILELGGAYFTADMPGGGERGAKWFINGSRNRLDMVQYLSDTSQYLQKELSLAADQVISMGRSWGGMTQLILAAQHSENFGMIFSVVPIIDLFDMFENGWFGRISQSDFAPEIDSNGDYILGSKFDKYIKSIDPMNLLPQIKAESDLILFTNGLDDRVDQGGQQEAEFAYALKEQLGENYFSYHRSIQGNHGGRYYQLLMFSLISKKYNLDYTPLNK